MQLITVPIAPGAKAEGGGVCNFMSWNRLQDTLRNTGEVRPGEEIEKITVESGGLTIYYRQVQR